MSTVYSNESRDIVVVVSAERASSTRWCGGGKKNLKYFRVCKKAAHIYLLHGSV